METWRTSDGIKQMMTWVFDQGGPVLGYMNRPSGLSRHMLGPGSIVSELEVEAAIVLLQIVAPHLSTDDLLVRWLANGSDACDMAVRIARAVTDKPVIISIGYHGSSPVFSTPPQNAGIPLSVTQWTEHVKWADEHGLIAAMQHRAGIAGVIVEVPSTDDQAAVFLQHIRDFCTGLGAVMILDDIVTGFRLALGGAAEWYGVAPDLACYGKAMSNGRGISALVGPAEMMRWAEDQVFFSNTYNGDPFNCAEVISTLTYLEAHPETYTHLWDMGERFKREMNAIGVPVVGHAPRSAIVFPDEKLKREFSLRMCSQGIVMDRPNYMSMAHHDEHLRASVDAAKEVMCSLKRDGLC